MSRNYTRELRREKSQGAKIVCSVAPFDGEPVDYQPRQKGDSKPWKLADRQGQPYEGFRYSGRECHAVGPNGGPWALARALIIPVA